MIRQDNGELTSQGVGEAVKDAVRPFTLAVDKRQVISVAGSASLHGLRGTGLLVVLRRKKIKDIELF
jgi:hypothetical protein